MEHRRLPVRPDLDQLRHQAKDLLRAIQRGEPAALAELQHYHREPVRPADAGLADAQLVLARSYQASSWPRLAQACQLADAIWDDDIETVRDLVTNNPTMLHEDVLIRRDSNWGPPMTYAANVGRDAIITMLRDLGATDFESAIGRAALQGRTSTVRMIHRWLGSPKPPKDALGGPAYTLNVAGTAILFELGARVYDDDGGRLAPVDVVLCSDSRSPTRKHGVLEQYERHGFVFPDTPVMALHRGRVDLLEAHLARDPGLLRRTFTHAEIFPPELGCGAYVDTQGTPLDGSTLLHMCVDWDEVAIAAWLLERGADANATAAVDVDGFGGHTPLFNAVVAYSHFWANYDSYGPPSRKDDAVFATMFLDRGADPNARASLRREIQQMGRGARVWHEHRDATPLAWGDRFPYKLLVSKRALAVVTERGGGR